MLTSKFLRVAALLTVIDVVAAQSDRSVLSCDDSWISITNQSEVEFYKTCPVIEGPLFFINHEFSGPFELPGVESLPALSSGYILPKLKGSDRVDDSVTSISAPDLKNITVGGILVGYVNTVKSVSFPKLESVAGGLAIVDADELTEVSLPVLSTVDGEFGIVMASKVTDLSFPELTTVTGGVQLEGGFNSIDLSKLKSASFIKIYTSGNLSCQALGKQIASVNITAESSFYTGSRCTSNDADNNWYASDPTGTGDSGSNSNTKDSAASALLAGYATSLAVFSVGILQVVL